jgi:hypothetical protein
MQVENQAKAKVQEVAKKSPFPQPNALEYRGGVVNK